MQFNLIFIRIIFFYNDLLNMHYLHTVESLNFGGPIFVDMGVLLTCGDVILWMLSVSVRKLNRCMFVKLKHPF